ncbi:carboxysome shell carbonic anhydrase [Acidiphilium sp.]|uniref:carboxysome shell carbonic anhydrase n=1 Tax=Acidiphilium sp. TaxID=527 RepID=UPI003CFD11E5
MNTRQRRAAQHGLINRPAARMAQALGVPRVMPNPACVPGSLQRCEHALVDQALNAALYDYECRIAARFEAIVGTLKAISAIQHTPDFVARAQAMARANLGFELPETVLAQAWVAGLDMRRLHAHCVLRSFKSCVEQAADDKAPWLAQEAIDGDFLRACGFHTVDVTPCADGRLQGLLPFVFRMAPGPEIVVKANAGALFDIESDMHDWAQREILRLSGGLSEGSEEGTYLKIAVYHFSSAAPAHQGCAAHASKDAAACHAALERLAALRMAIDSTFGRGAAPATLLIGLDTDLDAIRLHTPDAAGRIEAGRFIDAGAVYRATNGIDRDAARAALRREVAARAADGMASGMQALVERLLEANLSQIEYVIRHHAGRYAELGHDEHFICAGEAPTDVQIRNMYYFAHLDTVEEGTADLDVGIEIFKGLNLSQGLAIPVLVHFCHDQHVPGGRDRAVQRCRRVKAAIEERYAALAAQGRLHCQMAVSDRNGAERCCFIEDAPGQGAGAGDRA